MTLSEIVVNVFCPTGPGGGIKPNCSVKHSADTGASSSGGTGSFSDRVTAYRAKRAAEQASYNPAQLKASELSSKASAATSEIDKRAMFSKHRPASSDQANQMSFSVLRSAGGTNKEVAELHTKSATFHDKKSVDRTQSPATRKLHKKAAELHREASKSHSDIARAIEAGLQPGTPPGIVADKRKEIGLDPM